MGIIKALLIFAAAALDLAVMAWRVGTNELVLDAQIGRSGFDQCQKVALQAGKAVCEFDAVIRLDALHLRIFSCKCGDDLVQEVRRGIGSLLGVRAKNAVALVFVNRGVRIKLQHRIDNAGSWYDLNVNLNALPRVIHLLVGLGLVFFLRVFLRC